MTPAEIAQQVAQELVWKKEPPTEQNWYWHWNGDPDCAPLPTCVLFSGTSQKCFVSAGQLGIKEAIDCDQYGGLWAEMLTPEAACERAAQLAHDQAVDTFIDSLITCLESHGIDATNWDGDDPPAVIVANGIKHAIDTATRLASDQQAERMRHLETQVALLSKPEPEPQTYTTAGPVLSAPKPSYAELEADIAWRKEHMEQTDKELLEMEDWLIGNGEHDANGVIDRRAKCKDRIRDLIAAEGEVGDLKAERDTAVTHVDCLQKDYAKLTTQRDALRTAGDELAKQASRCYVGRATGGPFKDNINAALANWRKAKEGK